MPISVILFLGAALVVLTLFFFLRGRKASDTLEVGLTPPPGSLQSPAAAAPPPTSRRAAASAGSAADEITKLWALKEAGALTTEEFEAQKARLLDGEAAAPAASGIQLVLVSCGHNKIAVIKRVRELTRLGLKEALDMVDRAPVAIAENLDPTRAEQLRQLFVSDGAVVELR